VLVAKAAARLGRHDLAAKAFARLMRDPAAAAADLGAVDELMRKRVGTSHDAMVARLVAAGGHPALAANHVRLLAMRGKFRACWRALTNLHDSLGAERGVVAAAELLNDLHRRLPAAGTARWVARHVPGPVRDTEAFGHLLYALSSSKAGERECVRLFASDWRRPDARGWMLANLADALLGQRRVDEMVTVCRHALDALPHDHSYWWHRRFLAEAALLGGDFAAARALCDMPIQQFPGVRLSTHQIDLVAELRSTPWWRRPGLLRRRLRETFRRYDAAQADGGSVGPAALRPFDLLKACPGPTALLLCGGTPGVRVVRRLLAI
jgi:hypothetical protein